MSDERQIFLRAGILDSVFSAQGLVGVVGRGLEVQRLFTHLCRHKEKTNLGVPNRWNLKPLPDFDSAMTTCSLYFPCTHFCHGLCILWNYYSAGMKLKLLTISASLARIGEPIRSLLCASAFVWGKLETERMGYLVGFYRSYSFRIILNETCRMMLGCVFCLNKSTDLQRGPSLCQPIEINLS